MERAWGPPSSSSFRPRAGRKVFPGATVSISGTPIKNNEPGAIRLSNTGTAAIPADHASTKVVIRGNQTDTTIRNVHKRLTPPGGVL
jgi:hypothetical protein